jgi:hypothetical protein
MSSPEPTSQNVDDNFQSPIFQPPAPDGEIWNRVEMAILEKHVRHVKGLIKKEKKVYLGKTVIIEIKKSFGNRYSKKRLEKHKKLSAEWKKKKAVSSNLK